MMHPPSGPSVASMTVSSVEAHLVPHVLEVAPTTDGIVTRVFVREREVVCKGQDLLELAGPGARDLGVLVRSSVPGVVTRCCVRAGDVVARSRPMFSIARADDVLVVARFEPSAGPALPRAHRAWVRIPGAAGRPLPAAILSVGGTPAATRAGADRCATVRVVARLQSGPPAAICADIAAVLEIELDPRGDSQ